MFLAFSSDKTDCEGMQGTRALPTNTDDNDDDGDDDDDDDDTDDDDADTDDDADEDGKYCWSI